MCLNPECNLESVSMYCSKKCKRRARTLRERIEKDKRLCECLMCGRHHWSETHDKYAFCRNCATKISARGLDSVGIEFLRA